MYSGDRGPSSEETRNIIGLVQWGRTAREKNRERVSMVIQKGKEWKKLSLVDANMFIKWFQ